LCDAANFCDDLAMTAKQLQSSFFAQLADPQALRLMFEHLPEVYFFVKNPDSLKFATHTVIIKKKTGRAWPYHDILNTERLEKLPAIWAVARDGSQHIAGALIQ
jgi:hypothetical protein